jgi:glycine oxidase
LQKLDYIILGHGLAGASVAIQLLKRGKKILVIDKPSPTSASRVAAGLFNPITGRKMVKSWMADKLFPYLHQFYREAEVLTGGKFFFTMPVYRPFISIEEQNEWMAKSIEPSFKPYIQNVFTASAFPGVKDQDGGILLKQAGYLNTVVYLDRVRKLIDREGTFVETEIRENDISIVNQGFRYQDFEAEKLIICSGVHDNAWFRWLPIRALKGQTLQIRCDYRESMIINRGVYIVPAAAPNEWRIGATYDQEDKADGITEKAKAELIEKTGELISFPFNIVHQEYGFRPTTPDRRPILGRHPALDRVFTFNGMGTKGVSLAPYFSEVLVRFIENDEPINKEVDIERYKLLYWSSPKRI